MTKSDPNLTATTRPAKTVGRNTQRMSLRAIWNWIAPWFAGVLLAGATVLGLLTASAAHTPATDVVGLVTAVLGLVALVWLVKRSFDEPTEGWPLDILVKRPESLVVLVALLTGLGIGGLFLAAHAHGTAETVGYALFVVCVVVVAANLKHYYDERDSKWSDGGSAPD